MANSRDFTGKNRKFTGTKGITTPKGTTGQRVGAESGELRFNTTTELMEYYDGNQWKPIDAPPTISAVTTSDSVGTNTILNADGSSLFTITITGGNFSLGPTVRFIGSTGTEYTPGNITRVSASSITCTTLITMGTTDDPYDVRVTNTSGLSATLDDAFSYNAPPVFTVASGQLGTVYNGQVISGTTLNAGATDAEGNTITFTIISGSLPGSGLSISSSTGAITGTLASSPSLGNYSFIVRAATTEGAAERQFSIQVVANPFIAATGGTVTTSGNYKIHTFTSDGSFIVSSAGTPSGSDTVDYLVLAGGGGGGGPPCGTHRGGGGGAGGYREAKSPMNASPHTASPLATTTGITLTAQTYPVTVGGGGGGGNPASPGNNSSFATITSAGGGKGNVYNNSGGIPGGSGGGGGVDPGGTFGQGNTPPVSPPQGQNSGSGPTGWCGGSGGGGAGAVGGNGLSAGGSGGSFGGYGGAGVTSSITDSPVTRAGGGGADSRSDVPSGPGVPGTGAPGTGGVGGGGSAPGQNGVQYTGGGAGGAGPGGGGTGGSGLVVIRYKYQ